MPTDTKLLTAPAGRSVSPIRDEGYNFDSYYVDLGPYPVYRSDVTRPNKIRRPRPVDLFASATSWYVESTVSRYSSISYASQRDGGYHVYNGPSSYYHAGSSCPFPTRSDPDILSNLDLKLRQKIKGQKVDLLATLAEANKTASMVSNAARDLVSSFGALKRGHPVAAVRRLLSDPRTRSDRAIANRWLEYQWGVLPTLSDIYGAAEALATRLNEGMYHYYTVRHREERVLDVTGFMRGQHRYTRLHRARARVKFSSSSLMQLEALGITNPLASVYQLIPWSFCLDWVSNLGDILEGLDALLGVDEVLIQRSCGVDWDLQYNLLVGPGGSQTGRYRERFGVSGDVSFGALTLKGPLSTSSPLTRIANATGLIRQLWR